MYVPLLILRYLARRRIAWVSLIAVMLCTALVLVVISVMSGWLDMFRGTFRGLSGDVVIRSQGLVGFPYYEEMAERLESMPNVEAAVPTIEALGLANIQNGFIQEAVQITGLPIGRIGEVNGFVDSLYLNNPQNTTDSLSAALRNVVEADAADNVASGTYDQALADDVVAARMATLGGWAERRGTKASFDLPWDADTYRDGLASQGTRARRGPDASTYPGLIVGTGVIGMRQTAPRWTGLWPDSPVPVKMLLLSADPRGGGFDLDQDKAEFTGWIVDNSRTGVFGTDSNAIYADFDYLQQQLRMTASEAYPDGFDADGNPVGEPVAVPARTSKLHLKLAPGVDPDTMVAAVDDVVYDVLNKRGAPSEVARIRVETWDNQPTVGQFLAAVEKERALIVILFSFVSVVAVFLILCIFYMIVKEKTRDIGILKSVGATSAGIASIFLGYGAAIGVLGGALGILAGSIFVWNINGVHDAIGLVTGFEMWSAETYMFDKIPNTVRPLEASLIFVAAVISSIIGAVVPAILAAVQRPVTSLRFE